MKNKVLSLKQVSETIDETGFGSNYVLDAKVEVEVGVRNGSELEKERVAAPTLSGVIVQHLTKLYPVSSRNGAALPGKRNSASRPPISPNDAFIAANQDISLTIQPGEIFGLLGPNGAGKTTLVNQLLGLTKPTSGKITVEGIDVVAQPDLVKAISSYLPQQLVTLNFLEVWRALSYTGQLRGLSKAHADQQATQLIDELDLKEVSQRQLNQLSGGMKRVVGFAMALMGYPKLLVLDEPTNELDPARRRQVWDYLKHLNRKRQFSCILVTHNVNEAESVLSRVAILSKGRVVALGTPGELKQQFSDQARLDLILKIGSPSEVRANSDSINSPLDSASAEFTTPGSILKGWFENTGLDTSLQLVQAADNPLHWTIYLPLSQSGRILSLLEQEAGMSYFDDLKLSLPSLEDVYLGLIGSTERKAQRPVSL